MVQSFADSEGEDGMNRPADPTASPAPRQTWNRGMLGLAMAALFWERLWPQLWSLFAIGLVFFSVALFDLLPQLPTFLHWLVLLGFGGALLVRVAALVRCDYRISAEQGRERLERDSELVHRPLSALEDRPLADRADDRTEQLWQAHQRRMLEKLDILRVRLPSPGLARKDPLAVRMVLILVAAVAVGAAGYDAGPRLARAIMPQSKGTIAAGLKLDVWVTPPAYTGVAPIFLKRPDNEVKATTETAPAAPLTIPVGSTILAQISDSDGLPEIDLGGRRAQLPSIDETAKDSGYRGQLDVVEGDQKARLLSVVSDGVPLAGWPVHIVADHPPEVEFVDPPKRVGQANLALRFEARDDFALKNVWATISRTDRQPGAQKRAGEDDEIHVELPASGLGTTLSKGRSRHDYSAHPWAGTEVSIRLFAEDAKGQIAPSDPFKMVLPERVFNHPVARSLVEERKKLNTPDRETLTGVMFRLDQINSRPTQYFHDTVVFLNIAVARARLAHGRNPDSVASVQKLLWETALRIEDGEFAIADRDLRDVQERLSNAMRDGASSEELDRLMEELQAALDKYMSALDEHLQRQGLSDMPMNPAARTMESGDLQRMIEQTRDLAKTGAMDAAREMLARLNRVLDSIRDSARMAPPNGKMRKAQEMMDGLRGLARRQQQLLDQTFREMQRRDDDSGPLPQLGKGLRPDGSQQRSQQPSGGGQSFPEQPTPPGESPLQGMASGQQGLRDKLGRLMLQMDQILGAIPDGLGMAERAMKRAGQALGRGDAGAAVPQQTDALDQLRKATNQAAEQLSKQMQGQMGFTPGMPGQRAGQPPGQDRDPFGRPGGGNRGAASDDGNVKVPNERDILRVRKILDELHRRAGEPSRPQPEREYIDRLLRRF